MSENILVVEYEPRYTDRVKQALVGQPFTPTFARDGEEAIRALDTDQPTLIVLSSVVPKISTTELIRAIRGRKPLQETPILLTVSGYNGKSPKADAQRVGASDILPKPYSETEFLGKVQQILGIRTPAGGQVTSNELFGDLIDDDKPLKRTSPGTQTTKQSADVDRMLADTLGGMMPKKRDTASQPTQTGSQPVPRKSSAELDKMLSDTLSGLEKSTRKTTGPGTTATPKAAPSSADMQTPGGGNPRFNTERMQAYTPDRVPMSQPVFPQAAPEPPKIDRVDSSLAEDETLIEGVKFGQYVLVEKIATGGMAEVWKAYMRGVEGFQKVVAIKKILPHLSDNQDFIEMFIDEAKLAAQLNHNNIIHIYDLGKIQSSYYIAMEYIDGFDLKTILRRGTERDNPMTVELALFIASKIAAALDYAHRKKDFEEKEMGLVHRDVSPQNVLISQEGDIKLCDFGIAKAASKASHTQAGALKGKLQYMAPEQAWGRNIDRRSDIFALATVLFEMLTNRKLFSGDNELSILEQVREARVQPPSLYNDEVTPEIDKIVIKALQKDPVNRYQTAGEMARDIDAILYSIRPTPTSADLAIYMHRLSSPEPVMEMSEPEPMPAPAPAPAPIAPAVAPIAAAAAPAMSSMPMAAAAAIPIAAAPSVASYGDVPEPVKKKSNGAMIGVIIGLLVAVGGAAFVLTRPKGPAATTAATTTAKPATTSAAPVTSAAAPGTTTASTATTATTQTGFDPSLVDAEVQKRMAAERARLDAQLRAQQAAGQTQTATAAPARPTPAPAQVASVPAPAPAPVQTQPETRPDPTPARTEPAPQVAETRPEPAREQPAVARAREGDLVAAGTAGLAPPRIVRRGTVQYPAVARAQRVQGTVITSVLVSETGAVLDVRILRGIGRPVGLDEAAEQAMRRSTFSPAMKDGVHVRSWLTVPVEFKL